MRKTFKPIYFFWIGVTVLVLIVIGAVANIHSVENQIRVEMQEHFPAATVSPQSQMVSPPAVNNNPNIISLENQYNKVADILKKVSVSIYAKNPQTQQFQLLGSGVIVSGRNILTNQHIVNGHNNIFVSVNSPVKSMYPLTIVRVDPSNDLALLSVNTKADLNSFGHLGDSDVVNTGDIVFAMGNAYNQGNFLSQGMIIDKSFSYDINGRAYNHIFRTNIKDYIGTCGAPLVNIHGQVIGINNSVAINRNNSVGINYATPINKALALIKNNVPNQNALGFTDHLSPYRRAPNNNNNPYSLA